MLEIMMPTAVLATDAGGELATFAPAERTDEDALRDLAAQINAGHVNVLRAGQAAVAFAVQTGRLLDVAKRLVGHGHWQRWVTENCGFSVRTAEDYHRVAKAIDTGEIDPQHAADLTIRGILIRLRARKAGGRRSPASTALLPAWNEACDRLIDLTGQLRQAELDTLDVTDRGEVRKRACIAFQQLR